MTPKKKHLKLLAEGWHWLIRNNIIRQTFKFDNYSSARAVESN